MTTSTYCKIVTQEMAPWALCLAVALSAQLAPAGEVIGSSGRIGSFLLRAGHGRLAAVPRGTPPGELSPPSTPILVAAPAEALREVLRATPSDRVADLVLLSNGMVLEHAEAVLGTEAAATLSAGVLYFGVLTPGGAPVHGPGAPPSALAGRHAEAVAALLQDAAPGLRCQVLSSLSELRDVASQKMIWASALWLLCAARRCTVSEVRARCGEMCDAWQMAGQRSRSRELRCRESD